MEPMVLRRVRKQTELYVAVHPVRPKRLAAAGRGRRGGVIEGGYREADVLPDEPDEGSGSGECDYDAITRILLNDEGTEVVGYGILWRDGRCVMWRWQTAAPSRGVTSSGGPAQAQGDERASGERGGVHVSANADVSHRALLRPGRDAAVARRVLGANGPHVLGAEHRAGEWAAASSRIGPDRLQWFKSLAGMAREQLVAAFPLPFAAFFLPSAAAVVPAPSAAARAPLPVRVANAVVNDAVAQGLCCPVMTAYMINTLPLVYVGTCGHVLSAEGYAGWLGLGKGKCPQCVTQESWTAVQRTPVVMQHTCPADGCDECGCDTPSSESPSESEAACPPTSSNGDAMSGHAADSFDAAESVLPPLEDQRPASDTCPAADASTAAGIRAGESTAPGASSASTATALQSRRRRIITTLLEDEPSRRRRGASGGSIEEALASRGPLVKAALAEARRALTNDWNRGARPHALAAGRVSFRVRAQTSAGQPALLQVSFSTAADRTVVQEEFALLRQRDVESQLVLAALEIGPQNTLASLAKAVSWAPAVRCAGHHSATPRSSRVSRSPLSCSGASFGTPRSPEAGASRWRARR